VLGIVPKTYLPNYREFYEKRQFVSARQAVAREVHFCGQSTPFGNDLVSRRAESKTLRLELKSAKTCDADSAFDFSGFGGRADLCNLSASNITVGKADYRRDLCAGPIGKMYRGLSVFRRRSWRKHDRFVVGRPRPDL
jgi:NAD+ synthase (glutamine-hydrolysing)